VHSALDNEALIVHYQKVPVNNYVAPSALRKKASQRSAEVMLTPAQLRAARALVKWSREDLADASGVIANTIRNFENGVSDPKQSTLLAWRRALSKAGVLFIDGDAEAGPGVRLREPQK
jgi:DNA-binding XRE family transcriptional regulator